MRSLLLAAWRRTQRRGGSALLTVLGVALGVAVVLGVELANGAALRAMRHSVERSGGRATHAVVGTPELPARTLTTLRVELGERSAAPVVEAEVALAGRPGESLRLMGLDPLLEAPLRPYLAAIGPGSGVDLDAFIGRSGSVLMGAATARRLELAVGDRLTLRIGADLRPVQLIGTLEPRDDFDAALLRGLLLTDVASAQELLGLDRTLTRIDLVLGDGPAAQRRAAFLADALGPGVEVEPTQARSSTLERLTRGFRLNLEALSLLSLVVGAFLVHNAVSLAVVRRREESGLLRTLGATPAQLVRSILFEVGALAALGVLLGTGLGVGLGQGLVGLVLATINDLYFTLEVADRSVEALAVAKAGLLGFAAAGAAVALPLRELAAQAPHRARRRSDLEQRARRSSRVAARCGLALLVIGASTLLNAGRSIGVSYAALFASLLGFALISPRLYDRLLAAVERPLTLRFGALGGLAVRGARRSLSRAGVAIAALSIALAASIGVSILVASFRGTVLAWLDAALVADVFVAPPSLSAARSTGAIEPELVQRLLRTDGIARGIGYRGRTVRTSLGPILVVGSGVDRGRFEGQLFSEGDAGSAWPPFARGEGVLITEPLSFHDRLGVGDLLELETTEGARALPIVGVVRDYASDRGVAILALERFAQLFDDRSLSSLALEAEPGCSPQRLIEGLRDGLTEGELLEFRSSRELREQTLLVFDRTFAITDVLRGLTLIVALIGVLSALSAIALDARREFATMRAIGMTPRQTAAALATQAGLLGASAGILALPLGLGLAWAMVEVINRQAFGWTLLAFEVRGSALATSVLASTAVAIAASIWPAISISRVRVVEALRAG